MREVTQMIDRIKRITDKTLKGEIYIEHTDTEYDRTDLFLPPVLMNAKHAKEYILNQKPYISEDMAFTGYLRWRGNVMGDFHAGSFRCALKAKCPIVPMCFIDCFKPLDQKGSKPLTVQLHYLPVIPYEEYEDLDTVELAALVKSRIQECLDTNT